MEGLVGILLSLLLTLTSICAPDMYWETTVSDPVLTVPQARVVTVETEDGETETRRGRKLYDGDTVSIDGQSVRVIR